MSGSRAELRGAGRHPSVEQIGDAMEGLLSPPAAARVQSHLAGCASCRDVANGLREVASLLSAAPAPSMPPEVANRIDAALAIAIAGQQAADRDQTPSAPAAQETSGRVIGIETARHRRRPNWGRVAGAAAAVVAIAGAAVLGTQVIRDNGGETTAATLAESAPETAVPVTASGRDFAVEDLSAVARELVAAPPAESVESAEQPGVMSAAPEDAGAEAGADAEAAAPDAAAPEAGAPAENRQGQDDASSALGDPNRRDACYRAITGGRQVTPLAVDLGSYNGEPAAVVVLPSDPDEASGPAVAIVVGENCGVGGAADIRTRASLAS
jgi:Putative zinc-finger